MADETKSLPIVDGPDKKDGKKKKGSKPGAVPRAKARVAGQTETPEAEPEASVSAEAGNPQAEPEIKASDTQAIPEVHGPDGNGNGNGTSNGNGRAKPLTVKPVKARVSEGYVAARVEAGNGHTNGSGRANGHGNSKVKSNGKGLNDTGEYRARVAPSSDTVAVRHNTTSLLRDTDLAGLRLKLKREEWAYKQGRNRRPGPHERPLPYFLMRHRNMRARAGVGYTRSQAAKNRFGSSGPATLILRILLVLVVLSGAAGGMGIGGVVAAGAYYISGLPPVTELHGLQVQTTKIYDRNGVLLYDLVDEETGRRQYVTLDQISPLVISATVATEDASFWTNPGIDPVGILRAFYINYSGKGSSGASTITQQLVRQVNLPEEERNQYSFNRKLREAIQAVRFTQTYSKKDILEMYLNENYYGHRAYGIDAAALTYFGHSSHDLTLAEAALLAGMPQAPTEYDPFVNPDLAKKRQATVLDLMAKQNMITQDQAEEAKGANLVLRQYNPKIQAPHFVYYVKDYLEKLYGPDVDKAGLVVTTTLDLRVQQAAEKVAKDRIAELQKQKATNASIVIMRPGTGEILAMVGSVDYYNTAIDGQVNVATRERQPGSSFKPITYATAFTQGWTPGTVLLDTLTSFPNPGQKPYVPKNYDGKDHGWVTVRESLGNSLNIPAVKAIQFAGLQNTIDMAHAMGIKGLNRGTGWYGLSLTLGGGEVTLLDMTNAYSTLANNGTEVEADPILKIEDPQGRIINCNAAYMTGKGACSTTQQKQFADGNGQVIDPREAYMVTDILSDNRARTMEFGPNSPLKVSFPAAVKTGTTNDNRDSWTLGYTPDLTIGVWVGNSNNAEMLAVTGAIGAAVIWHNMMETFYDNPDFVDLIKGSDGQLQKNFVQPPGLVRMTACSAKGAVTDLFLKDSPPKGCTTYKDKNPQLHPYNSNPSSTKTPTKPAEKPTPLPGIWPPLQPSNP